MNLKIFNQFHSRVTPYNILMVVVFHIESTSKCFHFSGKCYI